MNSAFLYKWTELSTGKWYIGSRTARNCHPNDGYITSSKSVKPLILANPNNWQRTIIEMGGSNYIKDLERELLEFVDAARCPHSYNRSNAGIPKNWGDKRGPQSAKTVEKKRQKLKGRNLGLTYEQIHGIEKAKQIKEKKTGQQPWNKDKTNIYSQDTINKLKSYGVKPIMTPDGEFPSLTAAAKHYGITKGSMAERMRWGPEKYYYIQKKKGELPRP